MKRIVRRVHPMLPFPLSCISDMYCCSPVFVMVAITVVSADEETAIWGVDMRMVCFACIYIPLYCAPVSML